MAAADFHLITEVSSSLLIAVTSSCHGGIEKILENMNKVITRTKQELSLAEIDRIVIFFQ